MERMFTALFKKAAASRWVSLCLLPLAFLSLFFFFGIVIRRWWLLRRSQGRSTKAFVITVGNVTVGGTGKTPLIAFLLKKIPGVVGVASRGYRRQGKGLYVFFGAACDGLQSGDEAALLARRFPNALFAVCEDKWQAVQALDGKCDVIILDDGLQRYDIPSNVSIATIDCGCPDGYGWLLPRGLLREPYSWLSRVDCIVFTNPNDSLLRLRAPFTQPTVVAAPKITRFFSTDGAAQVLPLDCPVALLSGIARPERFRRSMEELGYHVVDHCILPDHGTCSIDEARSWMASVRARHGNAAFVATEKDWARQRWPEGMLFSEMELEIVEGEKSLLLLADREYHRTL